MEKKSGEVLEKKAKENFSQLEENPPVVQCCRIGAVKAGSRRPMKVVLRTVDHAKQIIRKGKKLKDVVACRNIFVCPDRSVEERAEVRKKVEERRRQRTISPPTSNVT